MIISRWKLLLPAFIPLIFLIIFAIWPATKMISTGLSLEAIKSVVGNKYYLDRFAWTIFQATVSTVLTTLLVMPAALVFAKTNFIGKNLIESLISLPLVTPVIVAAMAWLALIGPKSLIGLNLAETPWIIFLANIFYNYPIAFRLISNQASQIDDRLYQAAQNLGASRLKTFVLVTWPAIRSTFRSSCAIIFLYCFNSFGLPLVLGGLKYATIEVEIYNSLANQLDIDTASALALIQVAINIVIVLCLLNTKTYNIFRPIKTNLKQRKIGWLEEFWLLFSLRIGSLLTTSPIFAIFIHSLQTPSGISLANYINLFVKSNSLGIVESKFALINTLIFAILTMVFSLLLSLLISWSHLGDKNRLLQVFNLFPLIISPIIFSFGLLITWPNLISTRFGLVIAYIITALPLMTLSLAPAIASVNKNIIESAKILGQNSWQIALKVIIPLLKPAIFTGLALVYASVVGEFASTLVLRRPEQTTLSVAIFERLGQPGRLGEALALSVILLAISLSGFLFLQKLAKK